MRILELEREELLAENARREPVAQINRLLGRPASEPVAVYKTAEFALFALQRLDQCCLLPTDVGPSTIVHLQVKVVAAATCVPAQVALLVGLINGAHHRQTLIHKLTTVK